MDCSSFKVCSAPLCPEDLTCDLWYPDEEICRAKDKSHRWIKQQRKIQKKVRERHLYFTFAMLKRNSKIHTGTKGIDPDGQTDEEIQIKRWLAKHPLKKGLSQAQKQEINKRLNGA